MLAVNIAVADAVWSALSPNTWIPNKPGEKKITLINAILIMSISNLRPFDNIIHPPHSSMFNSSLYIFIYIETTN